MEEEIRFHLERDGRVTGPFTDDEVRESFREGLLEPGTRVRLVGTELWASPAAWATLAGRRSLVELPLPPTEATTKREAGPELSTASLAVRDMLLWFLREGGRTLGPLTGEQVRLAFEQGRHRQALLVLLDTETWFPVASVFDPATTPAAARPAQLSSMSGAGSSSTFRCAICLEKIPREATSCPECGEVPQSLAPASVGPPSIPDDAPNATWLQLHWRPIVTFGTILALFCSGIGLRYLAPGRFAPAAKASVKPAAESPPGCASACWNGEACLNSHCVWQKPNDVGHVAEKGEPTVGGPFTLPRDVSDALPLDEERFAVSLLTGIEVRNARTGEVLSLVTETPQARRLYRVGHVVYATAPQRIYVLDADTMRLLKTIDLGAQVGDVVLGAGGRRALASLPSAHSVAILATEYHAEIDRIQFGDDPVGPMGADDTGKRALATTGQVPLAGLRDQQGGAVYAFDPSRLASAQDRVRASMLGNPVSVLMTPNGEQSYVVLRAEDKVVPLEWLASGAVRRLDAIPTCREPEQIALVRQGRRAVVRCNEGRSVEVLDLAKREVVANVALNARVADLAVSPDAEQAVVALPGEGNGFVGLVDLKTMVVRTVPVDAEATRVRLSPNGRMAIVLADRAKAAWVVR